MLNISSEILGEVCERLQEKVSGGFEDGKI
jgi:hypothetical protein